jgi:hypothetical protein
VDDYDDAIYYLEKALKYKPDDNETKRKLDSLRAKVKIRFEFEENFFFRDYKKKETIRKLEYGPNLPSNLQSYV